MRTLLFFITIITHNKNIQTYIRTLLILTSVVSCVNVQSTTLNSSVQPLELVRAIFYFFHQPFDHQGRGEHVVANIVADKHLFIKFLGQPASQHVTLVSSTQQASTGTVWPRDPCC